jgi:hypothetical protein
MNRHGKYQKGKEEHYKTSVFSSGQGLVIRFLHFFPLRRPDWSYTKTEA